MQLKNINNVSENNKKLSTNACSLKRYFFKTSFEELLILFDLWKASGSYITKCLTVIHGKEAVWELGKVLTITLHLRLSRLIYS